MPDFEPRGDVAGPYLYANASGKSNVVSYSFGDDWIEVTFAGRPPNVYLYTHASAGASDVETMKRLAAAGRGLNSFISRVVKKRYQSKS